MAITIICPTADKHPAIIHQRKGNGSIAYGTKTINKTYQTKSSLILNPKPLPTKPTTRSN